ARRREAIPWEAGAGGLLARARRPARRDPGLVDGDCLLRLHAHRAALQRAPRHRAVRNLRRLPLPPARAPRRRGRRARAGAPDRRADPPSRGRLDRDRGGDPRVDLKRGFLLVAVLAVAVAVGLGLYADFGRLGDELASFRWELFPLALVLTALNYLIRFLRLQLYLAGVAIVVPAGGSFAIFVAGLSGTITPAKVGEVLKCVLLKRGFDVPVRRSVPLVL